MRLLGVMLLVGCAARPLPLPEGSNGGGVNGGGSNGTNGSNGGGTNGGGTTGGGGTNGGGTNGNLPAPRLISPPSTSIVTSRHPRLRWDSTDGDVDLCADRACTSFYGNAPGGVVSVGLPPNIVVFWRVRRNGQTSATWEFFTGWSDAPLDNHHPGPLDLDGDGVPDSAVGLGGGGVGVYLGGAGGLAAPPMVLSSNDSPRNHFGFVVAAAGDLDGDGYGDLAVGECGGAGTRVYVYYGAPGGVRMPQALDSPDGLTGFGCRVAGAGDLDGDGYGDLAVARVGDDFGGGLYIFKGGAGGVTTGSARIDSPDQKPSRNGYSLAGVGDFDADGYDDLASTEIDYSALTGRLHLYRGGPSGISNQDVSTYKSKDAMGLQFGASVASAGDADGDGYTDLVVGAPAVTTTAGAPLIHLFYGGPTLLSVATVQSSDAGFGFEVEGGGDLDGDGFSDVVVTANDSVTAFLGGSVRVLTSITVVAAAGQGANPRHAAFTGDLDFDGKSELLVADGAGVELLLGGGGGLDRARARSLAAPPGGFSGSVR
jgi:FG-GAP-like repeat/FG-GAP repeat